MEQLARNKWLSRYWEEDLWMLWKFINNNFINYDIIPRYYVWSLIWSFKWIFSSIIPILFSQPLRYYLFGEGLDSDLFTKKVFFVLAPFTHFISFAVLILFIYVTTSPLFFFVLIMLCIIFHSFSFAVKFFLIETIRKLSPGFNWYFFLISA